MTTIFGIRADKGRKENRRIILASDIAGTLTEFKPNELGYSKKQTKRGMQKIQISKDKTFALGMAGVNDEAYVNFLTNMLKGEYDIEKALDKGFFPEFKDLNSERWGGKTPDLKNSNQILIASRLKEELRLHRCYQGGFLEEFSLSMIGSGTEYVIKYLEVVEPKINLTRIQAINLTDKCLIEAGKDIYTTGFDIATISPDGITHYLKDIQEIYRKARSDTISVVKEKSR
jgi:hypothetical protein